MLGMYISIDSSIRFVHVHMLQLDSCTIEIVEVKKISCETADTCMHDSQFY